MPVEATVYILNGLDEDIVSVPSVNNLENKLNEMTRITCFQHFAHPLDSKSWTSPAGKAHAGVLLMINMQTSFGVWINTSSG